MSTAAEAVVSRTPLGSDLKAGIDTLSLNQTVTFTLYVKLVLPLDGFVFWINSALLSESALLNAFALNAALLNMTPAAAAPAKTITAQGSLHYATDTRQDEDSAYAVNRVVFTSEQAIQEFNAIGPNLLYIASFENIRFSFSSRGSYYVQSNTWHYLGNAIYSTLASQIVDDPRVLSTSQLIVSNSLPAWLAINNYAPAYPIPISFPALTLYPSFLSPDNLTPPYGTVHVDPDSTVAMQSAPYYDATYDQWQLARERIVVTLYGCNNNAAQSFLSAALQYSTDTDLFGIMNIPTVRDDKKTQTEMLVIAQKKRVVFDVSYNQNAMRNVARQLILSCVPTFYFEDQPLAA